MNVQVIVYLVTAVLTYILGLLSKYFGWNKTLPIPVQNIIVGVISVIIACVINTTGLNLSAVVSTIITTLGGVGTATVLYDTKKQQ